MTVLPNDDIRDIVTALSARVTSLTNAHVLLTGASGFFGAWLTEALVALDESLSLGLTLTVVARDETRLRSRTAHLRERWPRLRLLVQDVRELQVDVQPTHVIHAATTASASLNTADPGEMVSVIVDGTRRVLAATRGARRFLYVSSGAVYGPQREECVAEECLSGPDVSSPRSAYGEGKRLAEVLCAIAAADRSRTVTIARPFAFVGPLLPLDAHFAVGNFLGNALRGEPIIVEGDGTPVRSYMYGTDLVIWLLAILLDGCSGRPYNVGSEEECSIAALAVSVASMRGLRVEVRGSSSLVGAAHRYVPSVARARGELGLSISVPLSEALRRTLRWHDRSHAT
jgi:dTDP-glucose 4,6-dehydratase